MPTFEFTDGGGFTAGSTFDFGFTDTSTGSAVNFTLSTSGNPDAFAQNSSAFGGLISISDSGSGVFTLDLNSTQALTNFGATGGSIGLQLGSFVQGNWVVTFLHETNPALNETFAVTGASQVINFATAENYESIRFTATGASNGITIDSLSASVTCYLEGTGIATPGGRVAVEDLQPGDQILTAEGGTTTVRWLGIQPIDTATVTPATAFPVRFAAGSIAPGVPSRDLYVSPDHAMEIDGILYNATALVNGRSITQAAQMPQDGFTYYHIDTGTHELVLAEDAASETYLDAVGRDAFVNGHEQADAPIIAEMAVPRIVARRMVPQDVVDQLSARADALGLTRVAQVA
ncbi:hypothetical protein FIU86_14065 [Roseovarius sp. THAF9]|uniref:Hint domain-containing protein n=1 Tax=Roseovarius sp. THAF9 TaxID=2587847 RepID=UPI0012AAACE3|nr:Hint domain-containing protein [Roseovarius sp. THAF9]QFT93970.1 hypothetical protein FIU86_14065 [Roseovarius sp. THAF9]